MLDLGLQEPMRFFLSRLEAAANAARDFVSTHANATPKEKSVAEWAAPELAGEVAVCNPIRQFIA
jgi:hypothetical protein